MTFFDHGIEEYSITRQFLQANQVSVLLPGVATTHLRLSSYKITVALTAIACPITILLNLLVIIAVKTRRELKQNSNILLSSVALADLLVGTVSMPLSITLDTLVIHRVLVVDIICTIDFISVSVLHIDCWASFFHLLLITWERYVTIAKCMEYKAIVTRELKM